MNVKRTGAYLALVVGASLTATAQPALASGDVSASCGASSAHARATGNGRGAGASMEYTSSSDAGDDGTTAYANAHGSGDASASASNDTVRASCRTNTTVEACEKALDNGLLSVQVGNDAPGLIDLFEVTYQGDVVSDVEGNLYFTGTRTIAGPTFAVAPIAIPFGSMGIVFTRWTSGVIEPWDSLGSVNCAGMRITFGTDPAGKSFGSLTV